MKNKSKLKEEFSLEELDNKLIESTQKILSIKAELEDIKSTWNALKEDKEALSFSNNLVGNALKEEYEEKVSYLKNKFNEAREEYLKYRDLKKSLTEAEIKLSPEDMFDPDKPVKFTDIAKRADDEEKARLAAAEEEKRKEEARANFADIIEPVEKAIAADDDPDDIIQILFDQLVPPQGPAETVAGEIIRAMMRILYRDYNDGDKFYEGYGIETCGSCAVYLADHGYADDIEAIMERAQDESGLEDEAYTEAIKDLAEKICHEVIQDIDLFIEKNQDDCLDQDIDYIRESQPKYTFEIAASDDVLEYIEAGHCDSWKLKEYVENQLNWESSTREAEVERPWGYNDTSVTITNLTKDGLDRMEELSKHHLERFWEDLVSELEEEHPRHECEKCGNNFFEDDMTLDSEGNWICNDCDADDYIEDEDYDDAEDLEEGFKKPNTLLKIFKSYCNG